MKVTHILLGCLLASMSAGCGERSARITPESEAYAAESTMPVEQAQDGTAEPTPSSEFPFPTDQGGRLLADRLRPANQVPTLPEEKHAPSKRSASPAKLENPELSLPKLPILHPPSLPLTKIKPIRPTLVEGEPPLSRERLDLPSPTPVKLAAGPKIAWPSPYIHQPIPLSILARQVTDRASLDDPSGDASQAAALASKVPDRTVPAPFLRLTIPDPFEHRNAVRLRAAPLELSSMPMDPIRVPMK
jgi:hypothetical protein